MASNPNARAIVDAFNMSKGATWGFITLASVFMGLRLYCKRRGGGYHWDDAILILSWAALLANGITSTIIFDLTAAQLASFPVRIHFDKVYLLGLISTTLALLSQSWSKSSFAVTLLRMSGHRMRVFLWFAIISMNLLFGVGALGFWLTCPLPITGIRPLVAAFCLDTRFNVYFGISISAYSGVMDLVFALIPWKIIMPLKMHPKEKLGCAIAMSMGIFAAVSAFIKASKLPNMEPGNGGDPLQLSLWGVVEPAVTIMAASVPAMRVLVRKATAQRQKMIDEEETGLGADASDYDGDSTTKLATWGSRTGVRTVVTSVNEPTVRRSNATTRALATFRSTVATYGSAAASRVMTTFRSSTATWGSRGTATREDK